VMLFVYDSDDADLEVPDTCVRNSLLSSVELSFSLALDQFSILFPDLL